MAIDIEKMKHVLESKRTELQEQLSALTQLHPEIGTTDSASEGLQDMEDIAVDEIERDNELAIHTNEQELLKEVEAALKRIEEGTYGRCIDCGQPIPEKRLEALPWAARCVKDEEQWESRQLSAEE